MKRILMTLVAVAGMTASAGVARADWGGYAPPVGSNAGFQGPSPASAEFNAPNTLMGLGAAHAGKAPQRYGLLPSLRKVFRLDKECDPCNDGKLGHFGSKIKGAGPFGGVGGGGGYGYAGEGYTNPPVMQGTLVFPHHPYVRSPRDFFMYEPGR